MKEPVKKNGEINKNLADSINKKLAEGTEEIEMNPELGSLEEIDPEILMKEHPLTSIALSLYHMERTAKANLYINNCMADSGLAYKRENFFAILGGPDPELLEAEELKRLIALKAKEDAEELEKGDPKVTDLASIKNE